MHVLPYVHHLNVTRSFNQFTNICVQKHFDKVCYDVNPRPEAFLPKDDASHRPIPIWRKLPWWAVLILMVDLMLWSFWINNQKVRRGRSEGTFFTILFILSITVSFRIIYSIIAISIAALFANTTSPVYKFCTQSSLYVDYCSNFFSLCVTFFMSLNRCFCFTAKTANSLLFDGKHVLFPILFSGLLAISAGIVSVTTSQIQRSFVERLGFVDVGPDVGWKEVINRMFYIFPIGSIVCYVVLYYHLHQQARLVLTQSNQNRGEQKVFVQLLITTVLYGLLALIYELISFISWGNNTDLQLTFISVLNIFNSLPEISLPLLLICSSVQVRRRLAALIAPKAEKTMMTTMATKTTSSATNKDNFV
uniref:Serpentine receptor class gamma n=1 Tax=Caenorhabditis japonica TaxID=281687 RepID=A0A8R1I046_CAEJA